VTLSLSKKNEDKQCYISPSPFLEKYGSWSTNYMRIEMFIFLTTEKRLLILTIKTPIARFTVPSTTGIMLYTFIVTYSILGYPVCKKIISNKKSGKMFVFRGKGEIGVKVSEKYQLCELPEIFLKRLFLHKI
jgi:hypothetical protein